VVAEKQSVAFSAGSSAAEEDGEGKGMNRDENVSSVWWSMRAVLCWLGKVVDDEREEGGWRTRRKGWCDARLKLLIASAAAGEEVRRQGNERQRVEVELLLVIEVRCGVLWMTTNERRKDESQERDRARLMWWEVEVFREYSDPGWC
jgi:hypothetical protein